MMMKRKRKAVISHSVKEAIDSYPSGLCFSEIGGRPILVNRKMNNLVSLLTGHTVINADTVWEELMTVTGSSGCSRIDIPDLEGLKPGAADSNLFFRLQDGSIWHFRRQLLKSGEMSAVQTEASEITKLYELSTELAENNRRLEELRQRQHALLANIVNINRQRELLATKIKIHDDLGQCIIATRKALNSESLSREDYRRLLGSWGEAIHEMQDVPLQDAVSASSEEELNRVAELIGCRIVFKGEKPADKRAQLLVYSALREALTNAVRHSGADELTVEGSYTENGFRAVIFNNGTPPESRITEGGGLGSLRQILEQQGAMLDYSYKDGFALIVDIPAVN